MPNENFRPWAKALRSLCLKKLNDFGGRGTARQIADNLGKPVELIAPRLTELAALGVIRDSGGRRGAGRGRPQVVWETVDLAADGEVPGVNDGRVEDVPEWFQRYGN